MTATKAMADAELADWLVKDGERGDAEARRQSPWADRRPGHDRETGPRAVVVPLDNLNALTGSRPVCHAERSYSSKATRAPASPPSSSTSPHG